MVIMTAIMPPTPTFPFYDQLLGGTLRQLLKSLVGEGLTPPQVRDRLRDEHSVPVSESTVRRWIHDELPADTSPKKGKAA